MSKKHQSSRK